MSSVTPRVAREFMKWAEESGHAAMIRDKYRQTIANPSKGWGLGMFELLHIDELLLPAYRDCGGPENSAVARKEDEQASKVRDWQEKPPPPWSPSWPTEPGWYWYATPHRLRAVEARMAPAGYIVISCGDQTMIYEKMLPGLWLPLQMPELPEEGSMP